MLFVARQKVTLYETGFTLPESGLIQIGRIAFGFTSREFVCQAHRVYKLLDRAGSGGAGESERR